MKRGAFKRGMAAIETICALDIARFTPDHRRADEVAPQERTSSFETRGPKGRAPQDEDII
jgi:hypothetical protein